MLPDKAPAACREALRLLLLRPPVLDVAKDIQEACSIMLGAPGPLHTPIWGARWGCNRMATFASCAE